MIETTACDAEALRKAIDLQPRHAFLNQRVARRRDPRSLFYLGWPSCNLSLATGAGAPLRPMDTKGRLRASLGGRQFQLRVHLRRCRDLTTQFMAIRTVRSTASALLASNRPRP